MNYVEAGMTREERVGMQETIAELRPYLLALKRRDLGGLRCEMCGITGVRYDFHHTTYHRKVNYYDLQLLCIPCHKSITNYSRIGVNSRKKVSST